MTDDKKDRDVMDGPDNDEIDEEAAAIDDAEEDAIEAAEEEAMAEGAMEAEPPEAEGAEPYMPLDHKYKLAVLEGEAVIVNKATSQLVNDWVIFRAQDAAMIPTLRQYFKICSRLNSPDEHLKGVAELIERVRVYQTQYSCKTPD